VKVTITAETGDMLGRLTALGTEAPRAITRALNRTGDQVRTAVVRALAQDTGLALAVIRKSTDVQSATFTNQVVAVLVTGRRIPLYAFAARQTSKGVSYRLQSGRGSIAHAFIATMPKSGHTGVFMRRTRRRLPIYELFGPSLPHVIQKPAVVQAVATQAVQAFTANLDHEIAYLAHQLGLAA
jgi:hypothetical protein